MTDGDEVTFDLELPDATAKDFAVLATGISLYIQRTAMDTRRGANPDEVEEALEYLAELSERLTVANTECVRHLLLESDYEPSLVAGDAEWFEEELGIKFVGGEAVDVDDFTDIEVE